MDKAYNKRWQQAEIEFAKFQHPAKKKATYSTPTDATELKIARLKSARLMRDASFRENSLART